MILPTEEREYTPERIHAALEKIPRLLDLHRQKEAKIFELVVALASKLRPPTQDSVVKLMGPRMVAVKLSPTLRAIHPMSHYTSLRYQAINPDAPMFQPHGYLLGDPGINGSNKLIVIREREYMGQCVMKDFASLMFGANRRLL